MSMYPPEMFGAIEEEDDILPPSQLDAEPAEQLAEPATLRQVVREQIAECLYELAEFMLKPEIAGGPSLLAPITAERKTFSTYEIALKNLWTKFGQQKDCFEPFKNGIGMKCTKLKRDEFQLFLKQLAKDGVVECLDPLPEGMQSKWKFK